MVEKVIEGKEGNYGGGNEGLNLRIDWIL